MAITVTLEDGSQLDNVSKDLLKKLLATGKVQDVSGEEDTTQPQEAPNGMQEQAEQAETPEPVGAFKGFFPRTADATPFASPLEFAKTGVGTALDITGFLGRAAASAPEIAGLYTGDQIGSDEAYNKLWGSLSKTSSDQEGLAGLVGDVARDPLLPLSITPQGTLMGMASRLAGAVPAVAGTRLGSLVRAASAGSRNMLEAIGKGAAETALQTGVASYDRPVSASENVLPMALNTLVSRYGVTPGRLQDVAATRFYQTAKPPRDIVQKSAGRVSPQSAKSLLDMGVARGIDADAAQTVGETVTDRLLARSSDIMDRQAPAIQSPLFQRPETGISLGKASSPLGSGNPILQNIGETRINAPIESMNAGNLPDFLPSQISDVQTALAKPNGLVDNLLVLDKIAKDVDGELMVSPAEMLRFRRKIDEVANEKGAFKKIAPDLATEASLYRQARTEANAALDRALTSIKESGSASKEDLDAISLFEDTQAEFRNLLPWIEAFTKRGPTITGNKISLLSATKGNTGPVAKSILTGTPLSANRPSLSLPEAQGLYDIASGIGPKTTPLKSTAVSLADLVSRQALAPEQEAPTASVLAEKGAQPIKVEQTSKRWKSLQELLDSK